MEKKSYFKPIFLAADIEVGNLLENVSFNPDEEGELDSKKSTPFDGSKKDLFDDKTGGLF